MTWVRGNRIRILGVLLFVVALLAVGMSYQATAQNKREERERERFVECQANYNEVNNQRARLLTAAADKERAADRRVMEATAALWLQPKLIRQPGAPIDPAVLAAFRELQAALTAWRGVVAEVDKERGDHPVPDPPSAVCGGP